MQFIITYGTGKPGTKQETFEGTYREAFQYAADNACGWGFEVEKGAEMKYTAFRVDHGVYDAEKHIIDYSKYQVLGQRETDLNWSKLFVADTEEECKAFAFAEQRKAADFIPVYNPSGYSYTVFR